MALGVKNLPAYAGDARERCWLDPWVRKIPWRRKWEPTPVFLTGKSHEERSLAGYRPWGHKQLDTVEWLNTHSRHWSRCLYEEKSNFSAQWLGYKVISLGSNRKKVYFWKMFPLLNKVCVYQAQVWQTLGLSSHFLRSHYHHSPTPSKSLVLGVPRQSSQVRILCFHCRGLPLQRASTGGSMGSHTLCDAAKKTKKQRV